MQEFTDLTKEEKIKHFGEGEWVNEPDRVLFEHNGIKCVIRRVFAYEPNGDGFGGHLCGYCVLPKGHPWENNEWGNFDIDVHGGVTYCEKDAESDEKVIGFDCAHAQDITPSMIVVRKKYNIEAYKPSKQLLEMCGGTLPGYFTPTYKNMAYAIGECKSMAEQIIKGQEKCDT